MDETLLLTVRLPELSRHTNINPTSPSTVTFENFVNIQDIEAEQRLVALPVVSNSVVPIPSSVSQYPVQANACISPDFSVSNVGRAIGDYIRLNWPTTGVHYGVRIVGYRKISIFPRVVGDSDEGYRWDDVNMNPGGLE